MNHRTLRVENAGQTAHKSPLHLFTLAALSTSPTGKNVPPFSWTVMRNGQTWKMKSRKDGWLSLACIVAQASYSYFCPQAQPFTLSIKVLTSPCCGQGQPHDQIAWVALSSFMRDLQREGTLANIRNELTRKLLMWSQKTFWALRVPGTLENLT